MFRDFSAESNDNTFYVTGTCNNSCLMCSQPPVNEEDLSEIYTRNMEVLEHAPKDLPCIGISGGEPTMAGEFLFRLLDEIRIKYPTALIHFLTNGRKFADDTYVEKLLKYGYHNMVFGIPLHSDYFKDHDKITQRKGAFHETLRGLYNLANYNANIELRIVINKLNYERLEQMADYIQYNLPFVESIAFMGMEITGYAVNNASCIWIPPEDYQHNLQRAVLKLFRWNLPVYIYNIPLCILPSNLHQFSCKSISNWKRYYCHECEECIVKEKCCGLFSTSKWQSQAIHPIIQCGSFFPQ